MSSPFDTNYLAGGLLRGPVVSNGIPFVPTPLPPTPNSLEKVGGLPPIISGLPSSSLLEVTGNSIGVAINSAIVPTPGGFIDMGQGYSLTFDSDTAQGRITPAIGSLVEDISPQGDPAISYSGTDLRILLEATNVPQRGNLPGSISKQLLECTTISISVFRAKSAARSAGYIGVRGYARGGRTIAGTMILTQFAADVLRRFLHGLLLEGDSSKDSDYVMVDQLPPFNMTLLFCNELGLASYCRILGVELGNVGTVYSHNDMYTEQQISYMAAQMTPLLPMNVKALMRKAPGNRKNSRERTVQDVWDKNNPPITSDIFNA